MEEQMYRLENFMYLTSRKGVLGWINSAEGGVELIAQHYPYITQEEEQITEYVIRTCYRFFNHPDTTIEGRQQVVPSRRGYGWEPYQDGTQAKAFFSPMMFKGFSSRLATIIVGGEEIYVVRNSKDQAMSLDAYIALLQNDAHSLSETGQFALRREGGSYAVTDEAYPIEFVLHNGDWNAPITDVSAQAVADLGLILDDNARTMLDTARDIRQAVPNGIISTNQETVWVHQRSGGIHIGNYPNSHGYHERVFNRIGKIYPNLISNRAGVVLQFHSNDNSFLITANYKVK